MKQFIDYLPLLVFFVVWAMDERTVSVAGIEHGVGGIFSAAEFLLLSSLLVYGGLFFACRRLDKFQWITLGGVVLFCIPTIVFRDPAFLKWKAPLVNWLFAGVFLASRYVGDKPAIEHMLGQGLKAPAEIWARLNSVWVGYFIVMGIINLAVAFLLSEALWIQFKVFGNLLLSFFFMIGQVVLLLRHPQVEPRAVSETENPSPAREL